MLVYDSLLSSTKEMTFVWRPMIEPLSTKDQDLGKHVTFLRLLYIISRYTMLAISAAFLLGWPNSLIVPAFRLKTLYSI